MIKLSPKNWVLVMLCLGSPANFAQGSTEVKAVAREFVTLLNSSSESTSITEPLLKFLSEKGAKTIVVEKAGDCFEAYTGELRDLQAKSKWSKTITKRNITINSQLVCEKDCCSFLPDGPPFGDVEYRFVRMCLDNKGKVRSIKLRCQLE